MGLVQKKFYKIKLNHGDVIQLSFSGNVFEHSLLVVSTQDSNDLNQIFVAAHTYDVFGKSLGQYSFNKIRFVHIENVGI